MLLYLRDTKTKTVDLNVTYILTLLLLDYSIKNKWTTSYISKEAENGVHTCSEMQVELILQGVEIQKVFNKYEGAY